MSPPRNHPRAAAVGRRFDALDRAFEQLTGIRSRMLKRRLDEVDRLRSERHLELTPGEDDESEDEQTLDDEGPDLDERGR